MKLCVSGEESVQDNWNINPLAKIFVNILVVFKNIRCLKFYPLKSNGCCCISFANQYPRFSSTLFELHLTVYSLEDCLLLLDGRLNQLSIFHLITLYIFPPESTNINEVKNFRKGFCFFSNDIRSRKKFPV